MPQFSPDIVGFGDQAGYGLWDIGHHREHLQFVTALLTFSPPAELPVFDLLNLLTAGSAQRKQLEAHMTAHNLLRQATNVQGIDLSEVDLQQPDALQSWLGYHATEHAQIRQVLGIV